jgi:hypothetical protein
MATFPDICQFDSVINLWQARHWGAPPRARGDPRKENLDSDVRLPRADGILVPPQAAALVKQPLDPKILLRTGIRAPIHSDGGPTGGSRWPAEVSGTGSVAAGHVPSLRQKIFNAVIIHPKISMCTLGGRCSATGTM